MADFLWSEAKTAQSFDICRRLTRTAAGLALHRKGTIQEQDNATGLAARDWRDETSLVKPETPSSGVR
jgi:hypothetical protein